MPAKYFLFLLTIISVMACNSVNRYGRLEGYGEIFMEKGILKSRAIFKADSMISVKIFDEKGNEIEK